MSDDPAHAEFRKIIDGALPQEIVSNYLVVAEIVDDDGPSIAVFFNETMTPWLALGLLQYAEAVVTEPADFDCEEEGE